MDTYSYLAHHGIFANTQTGNIVLFAVHGSGGDWAAAARHLPPVGAFILGVGAATLLGVWLQGHPFRAALLCQGIELVVLGCLALFADRMPDAGVVPVISFVAALQNTSFGSIGPWTFNNAMTTGNIRNATSGLLLWLIRRNPESNRGKVIVAASACFSFLAGALCGGVCTRYYSHEALAPCVGLVLAGFLLTWRRRGLELTQ